MSGWFAVKRGITDHPIFRENPARLGAWIWMLDKTAWADTEQDVGGEIVTIRRGEFCASQAMMERGTGMPRQQLRTFMELLKREGVIETRPAQKSTKSRTIVSICNYDKYQTAQPKANQGATKDQPIKEQLNNIPVGADASASADPAKIMFDTGVKILTSAGTPERQARGIIGRWRAKYSVEEVITALSASQREGASEPVAFVTKTLEAKAKRKTSAPEINDTMIVKGVTKRYAGNGVGWVVVHD